MPISSYIKLSKLVQATGWGVGGGGCRIIVFYFFIFRSTSVPAKDRTIERLHPMDSKCNRIVTFMAITSAYGLMPDTAGFRSQED